MSFAVIFVAFLFPLTLYCLVLALINGRQRPLAVSGTWDFVGVLLALSGLLLVGGPAVLTGLDEHWRMFWLLAARDGLAEISSAGWLLSLALMAGYFLTVIVVAGAMLWRRRGTTSIYNVDPEAFDAALARVLHERGLEATRQGRRVWIGATLLAEVDPFPAMRHVWMRWGDERLRSDVEEALRGELRQVETGDNPAAAWLLWIGASLFLLMFGILALVLALTLLGRR